MLPFQTVSLIVAKIIGPTFLTRPVGLLLPQIMLNTVYNVNNIATRKRNLAIDMNSWAIVINSFQ